MVLSYLPVGNQKKSNTQHADRGVSCYSSSSADHAPVKSAFSLHGALKRRGTLYSHYLGDYSFTAD